MSHFTYTQKCRTCGSQWMATGGMVGNQNMTTSRTTCVACGSMMIENIPAQPLCPIVRSIYVASRASTPARSAMWRKLRDEDGILISSSWIDQAGEGESDYEALWPTIFSEIRNSKALILYAEPDDFPLKGAFIEVGAALMADKPVVCVLPGVQLEHRSMRPVGSWMRHPSVFTALTVSNAVEMIGEW